MQDRVAVVTGAASGIGRALVDRFLADGMRVVLADVEEASLEAAVAALEPFRDRILPVVTDVADPDAVDRLEREAVAAFGTVHLLCNNAGVSAFGRSWDIDLDAWKWVIDVNLWGVINGIRAFVPRLVAQDDGHVVNTASMVGVGSFPNLAPYSVTKHGVVALSEALDLDLRAAGSAVRVSVLCPGFVRTRIGESERNRPGRSETRIGAGVTQLLEGGMAPARVADQVADAIAHDDFWVFTHPEMVPAIELRAASMLENRRPETFDLSELFAEDDA